MIKKKTVGELAMSLCTGVLSVAASVVACSAYLVWLKFQKKD